MIPSIDPTGVTFESGTGRSISPSGRTARRSGRRGGGIPRLESAVIPLSMVYSPEPIPKTAGHIRQETLTPVRAYMLAPPQQQQTQQTIFPLQYTSEHPPIGEGVVERRVVGVAPLFTFATSPEQRATERRRAMDVANADANAERCRLLESNRTELESKLDEARRQASEANSAILKARNELVKKERELIEERSKLEATIARQRAEIDEEKKEYAIRMRGCRVERKKLEEQLTLVERRIEKYDKDNSDLRTILGMEEQRGRTAEEKRFELEGKLQKTHERVSELTAEITRVADEKRHCEAELSKRTADLDSITKQLHIAISENERLKKENAPAPVSSDKDAEILTLKDNFYAATRALVQQQSDAVSKILELQANYEVAIRALDQAHLDRITATKEADQRVESIRNELAAAKAESATLTEEMDRVRKEQQRAAERIAQIEQQSKQLESDRDKLAVKLDELKVYERVLVDTMKKLKDALVDINAKHADLKKEHAECKSQIDVDKKIMLAEKDQYKKDLEQSRGQNARDASTIQALETEIATLRQSLQDEMLKATQSAPIIAELTAREKRARMELGTKTDQLTACTQDIQGLTAKYNSLSQAEAQLNAQLQQAKVTESEFIKRVNELQAEKKRIEVDLTDTTAHAKRVLGEINVVNAEKNVLKGELLTLSKSCDAAKKRVAELEGQLRVCADAGTASEGDVKKLKQRVTDLEQRDISSNATIGQLSDDLIASERGCTEKLEKIKEKLVKVSRNLPEIQGAGEENLMLQEYIHSVIDNIAAATQDMDRQLREAAGKSSALDVQIRDATLNAELQKTQFESEIANLQADIKTHSTEIAQLEASRANWDSIEASYELEIAARDNELTVLRRETAERGANLTKLGGELDAYKKLLAAEQKQNASTAGLVAELDKAKVELQDSQKAVAACESEKQEVNTKLDKCQLRINAEIAEKFDRIKEKENEITVITEEKKKLTEEVVKLRRWTANLALKLATSKRIEAKQRANVEAKLHTAELELIEAKKPPPTCDKVITGIQDLFKKAWALKSSYDDVIHSIGQIYPGQEDDFISELKKKCSGGDIITNVSQLITELGNVGVVDGTTTLQASRENCQKWENLLSDRSGLIPQIDGAISCIASFREDKLGAVRVYVRIGGKPPKPAESLLNLTVHGGEVIIDDKTWGPFHSVYPHVVNNAQVCAGGDMDTSSNGYQSIHYDKPSRADGIVNLFSSLPNGDVIVLFGYGLSGSGKTYTLFGKPGTEEKGVVQIGMEMLQTQNKDLDVQVVGVFDLHVGANSSVAAPQGKIDVWYRPVDDWTASKSDPFKKLDVLQRPDTPFRSGNIPHDIDTFTTRTMNALRGGSRIKKTPLNPDSSRAHVVYVIQVAIPETKRTGFLIVMDMAGKEDPEHYKELFFESWTRDRGGPLNAIPSLSSIIGEPTAYLKRTDLPAINTGNETLKTIKEQYDYACEILKEGIYINETIHQLGCYLEKRQNRKYCQAKDTYAAWKTKRMQQIAVELGKIKNPQSDKYLNLLAENENLKSDYNPAYPVKPSDIADKKSSDTGMKKFFDFVDAISTTKQGKSRSVKYVMMCNVRLEKKYQGQTESTLNFADLIKSTPGQNKR